MNGTYGDRIFLRVEPALREELRAVAEARGTSVSDLIRHEMRIAVSSYLVSRAVEDGLGARCPVASDFEAFGIAALADRPWIGTTVTLQGQPIGLGVVTWDTETGPWVAIVQNAPIPPMMLSRVIDGVATALRNGGESAIHARSEDDSDVGATFERTGFQPTSEEL